MEMRIVGLSTGTGFITIQSRWNEKRDWHQVCITSEEFESFMKNEFPSSYRYFEIAKENEEKEAKENNFDIFKNTDDCASWYYNFGETHEMKRRGDAYIFRN